MATLATIFDKFAWARPERREAVVSRATAATGQAYALRSIPNDDIYFFVKRIDNSHVVREADPAANRACWKAFGTAVAGAALVAGLLAPSLYGLLSGYQLESLREEQRHLKVAAAQLELEETRLHSPEHMAALATSQRLVDPSPERLVYLDGKENRLAQR